MGHSLAADTEALKEKARLLRQHIVEMTCAAGSGHPGGSLSASDIVAALYFSQMKVRPDDPSWNDRDRFVLCKGHAAPVLYAALAERGFFPVVELASLRKFGSILQGHPDMKVTPGVDASTGSLGQGLSIAVGMAIGCRLDGRSNTVYALLGDGELQEGQVWEAAMAAAHYDLDNLVAIIDSNGLQIDGPVADVMSPLPIAEKWRAFGWHVQEIDGHDIEAIIAALEKGRAHKGQPAAIVAKTVKGKGVSFMEGEAGWHGKAPDEAQLDQALCDLRGEVQ